MNDSSSCAYCATKIPQGAHICANCGMPVSEAALPQAEEAPLREAHSDTQPPPALPRPVEQPISFLPPTQKAQQNRVRRGWPRYLTFRGIAKGTRPKWLPSWLTLPMTVIAGVVVTLALFFVHDYVQAGVLDPLGFTYTLPAGEREGAQTAPGDAPTAAPSPSPPSSPSDFLSSFLPPFLPFSPSVSESLSPSGSDGQGSQTASPASPLPSSTGGEAVACQQETDPDDFAQALDFSDATSLAEYLGLKGGKDKLAQVLTDCNDLQDLASSLGFSTPEKLAAYLRLDSMSELARSLRVAGELHRLAQSLGLDSSEKLAERLGVEKRKLVRELRRSENTQDLAKSLGFETTEKLAERLGKEKGELSTFFNAAITDEGKAATAEDKSIINNDMSTEGNDSEPSTTDDDISRIDEGKSAPDKSESGVTGGTLKSEDDGSPAKEAAGDETPSSTISTPLSPASSAPPPPPPSPSPSPPTSNEPSPPAAKEPPPVTDAATSSLTTSQPPSDLPASPATSGPLSSPSTSKTPTSEPSQEPKESGK